MARRTTQHKLNVEDIRGKINAHLGTRPLNEREWHLLVRNRYIEEIQDQGESISNAVKYVREMRWSQEPTDESQQSNHPQMLSKEEAKAHPDRSFALSLLLYEEATKDAEVIAFRTEVLANKLLNREMVPAWIQQQAKMDGEPTLWLELAEIPVARDDAMETVRKGTYIQKGPANLAVKTIKGHFLKYGGRDDWTLAVPTCIDGMLERLRKLSERLAREYGWQEAQATLFVLTGAVPIISPIQITHHMERGPLQFTHTKQREPLYIRQRIVLDVDPAVSPQEVAKHYHLKRKEIEARRKRKEIEATRTRPLTEKHLRLATFDAERLREESWAKKLAEWNRTQRPEWGYNDRRRFAHECLQARRRLLRSD